MLFALFLCFWKKNNPNERAICIILRYEKISLMSTRFFLFCGFEKYNPNEYAICAILWIEKITLMSVFFALFCIFEKITITLCYFCYFAFLKWMVWRSSSLYFTIILFNEKIYEGVLLAVFLFLFLFLFFAFLKKKTLISILFALFCVFEMLMSLSLKGYSLLFTFIIFDIRICKSVRNNNI